MESSTVHCRDHHSLQRLRAEGVVDHFSCLAFSFASDTPSPGSGGITSRVGQRLRAEGIEDHLSHLAFGFASDTPSVGSGRIMSGVG